MVHYGIILGRPLGSLWVPFWARMGPDPGQNGARSGPELGQKGARTGSEADPKGPPKGSQTGSKVGPKGVPKWVHKTSRSGPKGVPHVNDASCKSRVRRTAVNVASALARCARRRAGDMCRADESRAQRARSARALWPVSCRGQHLHRLVDVGLKPNYQREARI